jgi:hypothetical protein
MQLQNLMEILIIIIHVYTYIYDQLIVYIYTLIAICIYILYINIYIYIYYMYWVMKVQTVSLNFQGRYENSDIYNIGISHNYNGFDAREVNCKVCHGKHRF